MHIQSTAQVGTHIVNAYTSEPSLVHAVFYRHARRITKGFSESQEAREAFIGLCDHLRANAKQPQPKIQTFHTRRHGILTLAGVELAYSTHSDSPQLAFFITRVEGPDRSDDEEDPAMCESFNLTFVPGSSDKTQSVVS